MLLQHLQLGKHGSGMTAEEAFKSVDVDNSGALDEKR